MKRHRISGSAHVACLATLFVGLACSPQQRIEQGRLESFARFGRAAAMEGATAAIGTRDENGEGAVYVFSRAGDAWSPSARVVSPSPDDEWFGDAVALSGSTLVVGAPRDDRPGALRAGSVYVFERSGTTWSHSQTLSSPLPQQAWEAFGVSVAVDGDVIVVGAVDRDASGVTDAGAAYVFERSGSAWSFTSSLAVPAPAASDKLGSAVAVADDTIAVSALRRDAGRTTDRGAVFVFARSRGGWSLSQTLAPSDGASGDLFGSSIALVRSGSVRRLLVGAESADLPGLANAGAAYVFEAPLVGAFAQTQKLVASTPAANAIFGSEVAISVDYLLVGAPSASPTALFSGAAYVFARDDGAWSETAILAADPGQASAHLGSSLALWGTSAIVGATGADVGPDDTDSGLARAFRLAGDGSTAWVHSHALHAASSPDAVNYGHLMALGDGTLVTGTTGWLDIADRDLDGWSETQALTPPPGVGFGAVGTDDETLVVLSRQMLPEPVGVIGVMERSGGHWVTTQTLVPDLVSASFPQESANSASFAIQGDTLVFAAPRWNGGDGRVFVYRRTAGTWSLAQTLQSPDAAINFDLNFGRVIALDGNLLVVSEAPLANTPASPQHWKLFVYQDIGGAFVQQEILAADAPATFDHFGASIALSGAYLAVTQPALDEVTVYRRTGTFAEVWSLPLGDLVSSERRAVAMHDDVLVIGLPTFDYDSLSDAGELRVFRREPGDTYAEESVLRANAATNQLGLGRSVAVVDGVVTSYASPSLAAPGRVYSFPL